MDNNTPVPEYTLIVGNGEAPPPTLLQLRYAHASLRIAADGGYHHMAEWGYLPEVVIGDLDSLRPPLDNRITVIQVADQETNDLEKAISYAIAQNKRKLVVLGATGLRLDHTLKNLSVLQQFHSRVDHIHFEDALHRIHVLPQQARFTLPVGTSVSLFPLSGRVEGICTNGLKYGLNNEVLENGWRDGSSNEVVSELVQIQYTSGCLLLIVNHQEPYPLWPFNLDGSIG